MSGDPTAVGNAIDAAFEAFTQAGTPEEGMTGLDDDQAQLRKACRLIEAAETLQEHDGYHTAVVELSFGSIERSFEFFAIAVGNDDIEDFNDHRDSYERVAHLGAISQGLKEDFIGLYFEYRTESYYAERTVTKEETAAMFSLAIATHDYLRDRPQDHYGCLCDYDP